jgi:hypothetical protein
MNTQEESMQQQPQLANIQHPTFLQPLTQGTQHAVQTRGTPSTLNLDDIFGDCFFTPEGDQIFLSENHNDDDDDDDDNIQTSGEAVISTHASRPIANDGGSQQQSYIPVAAGGGINTTGLNGLNGRATTMGLAQNNNGSGPNIIPMQQPPQQRHHMQYAMVSTGRRKVPVPQSSSRDRKMSDQQKSERRYVNYCITHNIE